MLKYKKIVLGLIIANFLFLPIMGFTTAVLAQGVTIDNPTKHPDLESFIQSIAKWLFNIALVLAPILFVIAGFYYITAQGDPAKIKKAGDLIIWTAIGLILIMLTNGIIALLKDIVE
jgi:FtsH-binding integral membrane protein